MVDRAVSLDSEKIGKDKPLHKRKNSMGGSHSPYSWSGVKYDAIPTENGRGGNRKNYGQRLELQLW